MVPPTPKRMVWRVTEVPYRTEQRPLCCSGAALSWFCGWVLHSTWPRWGECHIEEYWDLKVDAVWGKGSANGWWCCWSVPGLPQLPPATPKNPPPFIASLLLFCFAEMGATSTASERLEIILFLSGKRGGKSHFGIILISAVLGSVTLHSQPFDAAYIYVDRAGSHHIPYLRVCVCMCWHPETTCRALLSCWQRGQIRLIECLSHAACFWLYRVPALYFIIHSNALGFNRDIM